MISLFSSRLRTGLLLAIAVTVLLNASNLTLLIASPRAALDRRTDAMDEDFYLSLIREVAEGHSALGNSSLREHRDDRSIVTFLPLIPGLLMRFSEWKLGTVLLFMDVLFPFLSTFLFFIAFKGLLKNTFAAAVATFLALSTWQGGLMNIINPKMVITFTAAYLAVFFGEDLPLPLAYILRGGLLSIMLYAYPHYFLYFGALELCDAVRRVLKRDRPLPQCARNIAFLCGAFLVLSIPYLFFAWQGGKSEAAADLWYRQVIPSHLPAAPSMQIALLVGIGALSFLWRRKRKTGSQNMRVIELLLLCLIAGMVILNQSALHGLDIMFGQHYRLLLTMFLRLTALATVLSLVSHRALRMAVLTLFALLSLIQIFQTNVLDFHRGRQNIAASFVQSDAPNILTWLSTQRGEKVILAPTPLAELIPAYTQHYVAWNGYAEYQSVTDLELAKRYVLQELVEPQKNEERDHSFPQIFSVYAGNRAAREKTWCRWRSFFQKSEEECRVPVESMIRNQKVLRQLEEDLTHLSPETFRSLLKQFKVDIIVADTALSRLITQMCPREKIIGRYTLYSCRENA